MSELMSPIPFRELMTWVTTGVPAGGLRFRRPPALQGAA